MPTPSEQKALAFVAIVILLGGAVRVVRAGAASPPSAPEQQALARQASAADSAATVRGNPKRARVKPKRGGEPKIVGGVSGVPPSFARPDRPYDSAPYGSPSERLGFPPPGPRIDIGSPPAAPRIPSPTDGGVVDLDVASARDIEALPRIGPAIARRIVANRDSLGPFRSLEGLKRVKGVGDATARLLASRVSFGGRRP